MALDAYQITQSCTYRMTQLIARVVWITLFRLRSYGTENIPAEGSALICCNHQSFLDPLMMGAVFQRPISYMARESLFENPVFGHLIRLYDAIPLQRDRIGISGFKMTMRRLKQGKMVLVFPEGTRSKDGQLGELKPGVCALVRRCRVPVLPVGIAGAFDAWPRHRRFPRPAPIAVQIGQPISGEAYGAYSDAELLSALQFKMQDCLEQAELRRGGRGPSETAPPHNLARNKPIW